MRVRRLPWQGEDDAISCRQLGPVLQSYIDDEAHELDVEAIRRHLEACRNCGLEYDTYIELKERLSRQTPAVPADVTQRLLDFSRKLEESGDVDSD